MFFLALIICIIIIDTVVISRFTLINHQQFIRLMFASRRSAAPRLSALLGALALAVCLICHHLQRAVDHRVHGLLVVIGLR